MEKPDQGQVLHRMQEGTTDAYLSLDAQWRVTHANACACELFDCEPQGLIGRRIWSAVSEHARQPFELAWKRAITERRQVIAELHHDPSGRWLEQRVHPSDDGLRIYILDIGARKRAEQLAAGQHEILAGIAAQQPLARSLERIACLHEQLNPGALCSILLLDAEGRRVQHGAAPSLPEAYHRAIDGAEIGEGRGSCGTAAWRRERVVVADIATHPFWQDYRELALAHGLRACWSMPVFGSAGQVLGTFAVYYREPREPTRVELDSVDRMLSITAIAIESDQLLTRLRERDFFFDISMEIYCIFDTRTQHIVQANPTFTLVTGYSDEELCARHFLEFVHPDDVDLTLKAVAVLDAPGKRVSDVVYRFLCKDGSYRWLSWQSVVGPEGLAFAVAHDVTERHEAEARLAHAASHDPVTGLSNRSALEAAAASMLAQDRPLWILLLGLDRFQTVNESMGHVIGDRVLERVAARIEEALAGAGIAARFTGDELAVMMPGPDESAAVALAQRLRAAVAQPIEGQDYRLVVTASVGLTHAPEHGTTPADLLRRAEAALARAKRHGGDSVCVYSVQHMRDIEERLQLGHRLRGAALRGELELHYQPLCEAHERALAGFEALLRWNDPEHGQIPPDRFIPIAESLGLMPEVGQWVIEEACRQARQWLDGGHRDFTIAINVSAQQLRGGSLARQLREALRRQRLPGAVLSIELTESTLMEDVQHVLDALLELKALGVQLAVDDFGTGYSSLSYLKRLPIDKVKIDRSFVDGLPDDVDDATIARTIVAMGHQLRLRVAAEGVESEAQARFLDAIGCDELQGYLLGRPLPATEARQCFGNRGAGAIAGRG